jgi:hypothetical protein
MRTFPQPVANSQAAEVSQGWQTRCIIRSGRGDGLVVCMAVSHSYARRAIGVEVDRDNFRLACRLAIDRLTKNQLKKVNFWLGHNDNEETVDSELLFDYRDATVVYYSLEEEEDDIKFFEKRFDRRKVRIIRKDLPLVGYAPIGANRANPDCWFFMHKYKLDEVESKDEWARLVLGRDDVGLRDVREYFRHQLEKRDTVEEDIKSSLRNFNRLASSRFSN